MCCVCVGGGQWLECPASGAGPFLSTAYELAMLAATPSSSPGAIWRPLLQALFAVSSSHARPPPSAPHDASRFL